MITNQEEEPPSDENHIDNIFRWFNIRFHNSPMVLFPVGNKYLCGSLPKLANHGNQCVIRWFGNGEKLFSYNRLCNRAKRWYNYCNAIKEISGIKINK